MTAPLTKRDRKWRIASCLECGCEFQQEGKYHRFCPKCGPHDKDNRHESVPRGRITMSTNTRDRDSAKREREHEA